MKKLLTMLGAIVILTIEAKASTVAYWPLAGENGVRTTTSDVFQNVANPGTMDAVPVSIKKGLGETGIGDGGSTYCPIGTNAFPSAYGVYDPVSGTSRAAATGLYFQGEVSSHCGAIRVVDPDALKVSSFTVEYFFKPNSTKTTTWQFMAVMPLLMKDADGTRKTGGESWSMGFGNSVTPSTGGMIKGSGLFWMRFATTNSVGNFAANEVPRPFVKALNCFDDRWHHIAVTVQDGTEVKLYFDYGFVASATLGNPIEFAPDGDLYIGGTPHNDLPFYGAMAHFRVSDEVLTSDKFLHFTRTERAADEASDVLLHLNFEAVDGISKNNIFFNQAATGSAVHFSATNSTGSSSNSESSADVYTNKLYASRRDYTGSDNLLSWNRKGNTSGEPSIEWLPSEDVFAESSFTVEMFVKTSTFNAWTHLFKRRIGGSFSSSNQIWIGGNKNNNQIKWDLRMDTDIKTITDTSGTIKNGSWHHIAVVYDKDANKLFYYRDWVKISEIAGSTKNVSATTDPIQIGGNPANGGSASFTGFIDEVRITKRALGVKEFLTPERAQGLIIFVQ